MLGFKRVKKLKWVGSLINLSVIGGEVTLQIVDYNGRRCTASFTLKSRYENDEHKLFSDLADFLRNSGLVRVDSPEEMNLEYPLIEINFYSKALS